MRRRDVLQAGAGSALLAACAPRSSAFELRGGWVGAKVERGHRLRQSQPELSSLQGGPIRRTRTLIIGGGVAGLACARGLVQAGIDDVAILELEDEAGGNSRGHQMGGMACPLGAHYLPLPGPEAPAISQLLEELGLSRQHLGRTVFDERNLCHSPQERLLFRGQWLEGLLPPAEKAEAKTQYQRFARAVAEAKQHLGFAIPSRSQRWQAGHAELDAQTFANWLDGQGLVDAGLRWYLDYCCRDDFGADAATVSAWAGIHYFASRHGFHPPDSDESAGREAVLTWPEGNAWLTRRMAQALGERIHCSRTVLRVESAQHEMQALVWNESTQSPEQWVAQELVMATPLFIAKRLLGDAAPMALRVAADQMRYAPWLVANLQLKGPLLQRVGAPPAWDNVIFGRESLGYVDAMHQSLRPQPGPTVLTAYWALPQARRTELYQQPWSFWFWQLLQQWSDAHPELPQQLEQADLMRWGHAMSIPVPGQRSSSALASLCEAQGRIHFAHSDLAGYSVFEEAYSAGHRVARRLRAKLHGSARR
ncbi:flavin monoamine oxidase family protein [Roseateles sp.]|uniref:flavin monoamine oxidase family protein n=1 Tax=Roseateles sp. TaxID=1971397 RepID=UPI003BA577F4